VTRAIEEAGTSARHQLASDRCEKFAILMAGRGETAIAGNWTFDYAACHAIVCLLRLELRGLTDTTIIFVDNLPNPE